MSTLDRWKSISAEDYKRPDVRSATDIKLVSIEEAQLLYDLGVKVYQHWFFGGRPGRHHPREGSYIECVRRPSFMPQYYGILKDD